MLRSTLLGCAGLVLSQIPATGPAVAQDAGPLKPITSGIGSVAIPNSSRPSTGGGGVPRPHTHSMRFVPAATIHPDDGNGTFYETPASLACVYRQGPMPYGCIPGSVTTVASGGSRTIAIVDAYDHPNIASDLARYSSFFGLPAPNIQVVFAGGTRPAQDPTGGWKSRKRSTSRWRMPSHPMPASCWSRPPHPTTSSPPSTSPPTSWRRRAAARFR